MSKDYDQYRAELKDEQAHLPKTKIQEELEKSAEYVRDLDNLPPQKHHWVHRGAKVSCEGGDHPHHSHYLT